MSSKWDDLFGDAADQMRPFNDELIYGYRAEKINLIPQYLVKSFHQVMEFFGNQMKYIGYRTLTPEEHIDYLMTNQLTKGSVQIRHTETSLVRFEFEFEGRPYFIYIDVPYLVNERVLYNDTEYFPRFVIVEKGGINRTDHGVIIVKVMRVPITFGRRSSDKVRIISVDGKIYPDQLITVKIHQGSSAGKRSETTPLVLYHLAKLGYKKTMVKYKINPLDISLSPTFDTTDKVFEYFNMPDGQRYLKVKRDVLANTYTRRMVLSLYKIFTEMPEFSERDAFSDDSSYYKAVLGKFIGSKDVNMTKLLIPNATKHLEMTDPMLDQVAQEQLKTVGCYCNDVYDLLYWMYYNIDDQLVTYEPTNLYDKKLESLDNLASCPVRNIALTQYGFINSKKTKLDDKAVEQFCKRASQRPSWITSDDLTFIPNPARYNDNWLLTVGAKRLMSLESIASANSKRKRNGGKTKTSPYLLKANPSQLTVTAMTVIPASSPVVTGDINPYTQFDHITGNIIKPEYASEVEDVFL